MKRHPHFLRGSLVLAALAGPASATAQLPPERLEDFRNRSLQAERAGLAEPFRGVTAGGEVVPGLFAIRATGVSTEPVRAAAAAFLATLTPAQRSATLFPVDDDEWRKWMNQHFYVRQGMGFAAMTEAQREAAFGLVRAGLSAKGLELTRDIMRLNHTLGELTGNFDEYGEWLYWVTVMGEPSADEPWGWQLEGHHLVVNYFVLGDQVVMTPLFVGSEPVTAPSGKYEGVSILQDEQDRGLAMLRALTPAQRERAVLRASKEANDNVGEAFRDNLVLDYAGVRGRDLAPSQREQLLSLIELYVSNLREGHARVRMDEVRTHLDDTWFAWIGGSDEASVYYYRVHSPVILIEFDHQRPVALRQRYGTSPSRQHIHAVVRTPNGNDYGKDLLRQHYQRHAHE